MVPTSTTIESRELMPAPLNRIVAYDQARALAIIGMILVNAGPIMDVHYLSPAWLEAFVTWITGRAAALFVVLAGAGMAMAYERAPVTEKKELLARIVIRALLLGLMGAAMLSVWRADILHCYTTFLLVAACLLTWPTRRLANLVAVLTILSLPLCALAAYHYEGGDWGEAFLDDGLLAPLWDYLFHGRYYPVLPWICFLLQGMLVGRLERIAPRRWWALMLVTSSLLVAGIELTSAWLETMLDADLDSDLELAWWRALALSEGFPVFPLFLFSAGSSALAVISAMRLFPRKRTAKKSGRWLACLGRISLSVYVGHILIGLMINQLILTRQQIVTTGQTIAFATGFILAALVFARIWRQGVTIGPLEWVLCIVTGWILRTIQGLGTMASKTSRAV